jgi:hypothetical protein
MEDFNEKNCLLKNWLKKVKNYYNGLRYVMENKSKLTPHIDDVFLKDLVGFYNKLFFADKQFVWFFIEHYCKGKTMPEIVKESGFCRAQVYIIKNKFLMWLDDNCNS